MRKSIVFASVLLSASLLLDGPLLAAGPLKAGKVKLVGRYTKIRAKEGGKMKTYFVLQPGKQLRLKAGGPTTFVLLARGPQAGEVTFKFRMDKSTTGEVELDVVRKLSRGMFVEVPEGQHLVAVSATEKVFLRPMRVRRQPIAGEKVVAWSMPPEDIPPLVPTPTEEPPAPKEDIAVAAIAPPPAAEPPLPVVKEEPETVVVSKPKPEPEPAPPVVEPRPAADSAAVISAPPADPKGRPIEVRLRMLADRLAASFSNMPGQGRYQRLIVARFTESGEAVKDMELGRLVSAQLSTYLKRDHDFFLLERERLADVLKEIEMAMTGLLDTEKVADLGKMAGAQAIVVGSISQAGADFMINARVISAETAVVLVAESMTVPRAGMVALSDASVVLRSRSESMFRSLLVPGWGQFYNQQPIKGGIVIGVELALIGTAVAMHFLGAADEDEYLNSAQFAQTGLNQAESQDLQQKAVALRESAEDYYGYRNIFIYSAAAVWLYNVLDAYLFGIDGEKEAGLEVTPMAARDAGGGSALGMGLGFSF